MIVNAFMDNLCERVLEHMRVARCEFEAGELAEALQVELGDAREALSILRKSLHVTMRNEDGHPLYRAAGTEPSTIPGSSASYIKDDAPKKRGRPAAPAPIKPSEENPMPKTKAPRKAGGKTIREQIVELLIGQPGMKASALVNEIGAKSVSVATALSKMQTDKVVRKVGSRPYGFELVAGGLDKEAARPKAKRRNAPSFCSVPVKDLAREKGRYIYAIDARGTVVIGTLRLPPSEIVRLVAFLEKTQHVWKAAA